MKAAQAADAADIITLQAPPSGATVIAEPAERQAGASRPPTAASPPTSAPSSCSTPASTSRRTTCRPQVTNRDLNDGTNFRRARFGIDGKLFKDFDYALIYEFGGSGAEDAGHIQEAWVQYTGWKPWRIQARRLRAEHRPAGGGLHQPDVDDGAPVAGRSGPQRRRRRQPQRPPARPATASGAKVTCGIATRWFASAALTGNTVSTLNSTGGFADPAVRRADRDHRPLLAGARSARPTGRPTSGSTASTCSSRTTPAVANPRYPIQLRDRPELRLDGTRLVDTGAIDARAASVYGGRVRRSAPTSSCWKASTSSTRSTAGITTAIDAERPRLQRLVRAGRLGADRREPSLQPGRSPLRRAEDELQLQPGGRHLGRLRAWRRATPTST